MTATQELSRLHAENKRLKAQLRAKVAQIQKLELELKRTASDRDILEEHLKSLIADADVVEEVEDKSEPGDVNDADKEEDDFEPEATVNSAPQDIYRAEQSTATSTDTKPRETPRQIAPPRKTETPLSFRQVRSELSQQAASQEHVKTSRDRIRTKPLSQAPVRGASVARSPLSTFRESKQDSEDVLPPDHSDTVVNLNYSGTFSERDVLEEKPFLETLINRRTDKMKLRDEANRIPDSAVYTRLKHLKFPLFPLEPSIPAALKEKAVSRKDLSAKFGGNPHTLVHRPRDSLVLQHGYTHFLCPMLSLDPHAPQVPGAHGLLLRTGSVESEDLFTKNSEQLHKVIVGLAPKDWLYMGEYEIHKSDPLSVAEWCDAPRAARTKWILGVHSAKSGLRIRIRASIYMRNRLRDMLGSTAREPKSHEVDKMEREILIRPEVETVTMQEIADAFNSGEEKINVWLLKCVGYDEEFQRQLVDEIPAPCVGISYKRRRKAASDCKAHIQPSRPRSPSHADSPVLPENRPSDSSSCDDSNSDSDSSHPPALTQVKKRKPTPDFVKRELTRNKG